MSPAKVSPGHLKLTPPRIVRVYLFCSADRKTPMGFGIKGILLAILGLVIGAGGGWLFYKLQVANSKENFFSGQWPRGGTQKEQAPASKLLVDGTAARDLGKLLSGTKTSVDFLLRNPSNQKLKFRLAGDPPSGITVDLPPEGADINPNGTYPVTLTVSPTAAENKFSKSVVIQIGDTDAKTILTVNAQVELGLTLSANELVFSRSQLASANVKELELVSSAGEPLKLSKVAMNGSAPPPGWLTVEPQEMPAEQLGKYPGAKSGLVVRFTVGSELPADVKQAKLELVTNSTQSVPQVVNLKFED